GAAADSGHERGRVHGAPALRHPGAYYEPAAGGLFRAGEARAPTAVQERRGASRYGDAQRDAAPSAAGPSTGQLVLDSGLLSRLYLAAADSRLAAAALRLGPECRRRAGARCLPAVAQVC